MELEQKRIVYCRRQLAQTSACTETADCIVPDDFPDVGRVVYACGTAAIGDHAPQNGRLLISGTVQAVILYEPENGGGLRRLEVPLSFAHIEECAQLDSSSVCLVECRVSAVEASVVNSRKLSIAADLVLTAECYDKTACEYTENIADDHTELLSETCEVVLPDEAQLFSFSVLEDIPVEETDGLSLLKQSCTLHITECRAMRDRIVVLLGGRVAEQLEFDDISTGASNDLQRATKLAHDMIAKYGMNERIGAVAYDDDSEIFVGRDYERTRS